MWPAEAGAWSTLALVERLAAGGLLIASAEQLTRSRALATGLLSWEVAQLRNGALSGGWQHRLLDPR
jgi:hypothetical protein